jgi:amidase
VEVQGRRGGVRADGGVHGAGGVLTGEPAPRTLPSPLAPEGLAALSASELRRLLGRGEITAAEVVEAALERVAAANPRINAIVTLNEGALEDARRLDRQRGAGAEPGLLFGLPVGIKDVTPVAGLRTTFGSPLYRDYVPAEDALVVQRIRQAGGVILGKTNTPEFGAGGNTFNEVFGRTRNPWDPERSAGGSTGGGAAALATGMIALAEGTDLGGSLRIPASFCGVFGLRPSPGLVPTHPSDYVWDTLQVTGPLARTAADLGLMLQAVAGADPRAPLVQPTAGRDFAGAAGKGPPRGARVAYVPDIAGIGVEAEIQQICRRAAFGLQAAGALVEELPLELTEERAAFITLRGHWMLAQQHRRLDRAAEFGPNVAANVRAGLAVTTAELAAAEDVRSRLWHRFRDIFTHYDFLLTPCMAIPPFDVERNYPESIAGRPMATYVDWLAPTFVLSLTGLPVAAVPCGWDGAGLPVGLQVVGPPRGEEAVLGVAAAL